MWAKNWRGQNVDPQTLLNRYRMKIGASPIPGDLKVVGLQETSGRAELRNVIHGSDQPVVFRWTWKGRQDNGESPLEVTTVPLWDDVTASTINAVNLTVNTHSYYWPRAGQDGAHIVYPAAGGDQVSGWGLAQDLEDQPTGDNRYQTLTVYWGRDGSPIPNPDPGPGPVNPDPQPGSYPPPTGRLYGIHGPKDRFTDDDFEKMARIKPGLVVVTDPNMDKGTVERIRQASPGVFVLGRFFGSPEVNAWRPPYWDPAAMTRYGVFCKQRANDIGLDGAVFANEPGIDDPDQQDGIPYFGAFWWTLRGYQMLASGCKAWIDGWDSVPGRCLAGTLPLSPGHHEDDDPDGQGWTGAEILAPVFERFPLKVVHNYYHRGAGSETDIYFGGRVFMQAPAYGWDLTRDLYCVSEWNRDEPKDAPFGDAEKATDVVQSERFVAQHRGKNCLGLARFIWRSDSYPLLSVHDRDEQINLAIRLNSSPTPIPDPEVPVPDPIRNVDCQIVRTESGLAILGKPYRAILHISRKDNGQPVPAGSILSLLFGFTRKLVDGVDTAPIPAFVKFYQVESGGRVAIDVPIPANAIPSAEASEGAYFEATILGLADLVGYDEQFTGQAIFPVEILKDAPAPVPPGPNPDQPGPTPEPSQTTLWAELAGIFNTTGKVDQLITKGQYSEAQAVNLDIHRAIQRIKVLIGFPQ